MSKNDSRLSRMGRLQGKGQWGGLRGNQSGVLWGKDSGDFRVKDRRAATAGERWGTSGERWGDLRRNKCI